MLMVWKKELMLVSFCHQVGDCVIHFEVVILSVSYCYVDWRRKTVDWFCPNVQSSSFQHPMDSEMNIASGCPLFITIIEFYMVVTSKKIAYNL